MRIVGVVHFVVEYELPTNFLNESDGDLDVQRNSPGQDIPARWSTHEAGRGNRKFLHKERNRRYRTVCGFLGAPG